MRIFNLSWSLRSVLRGISALSVLASGAALAQDYRPAFHPDTLKGPPAGAPNEVLTLGSPHLSGAPDFFTPSMLDPLLDRLAAWRPTAIATEDLSGLQCDALRRYPARYAATVDDYCPDVTAAARATGLDVPAANAEAERLLAACRPRRVRPTGGAWLRCFWRRASVIRRWCNGCACRSRSGTPATVWTMRW